MKISKTSGYEEALQIGLKRKGAILLDLGCCCRLFYGHYTVTNLPFTDTPVGNDVRKVAADGFPIEQVLASDLKAGGSS